MWGGGGEGGGGLGGAGGTDVLPPAPQPIRIANVDPMSLTSDEGSSSPMSFLGKER